jgi:hypothetical protein
MLRRRKNFEIYVRKMEEYSGNFIAFKVTHIFNEAITKILLLIS